MDTRQISPAFFVLPQVWLDALPELARAGYRGIVNNRPDGEEPGQPPAEEIGAWARQRAQEAQGDGG